MKIAEALRKSFATRRRWGTEATDWDARILLAHALGHRKPLALDPLEEIPADAANEFDALWERRVAGVPVQHLIGEWDFFGRPFFVDSRALVPRPETELLVETALAEASGARRVLDLGTGSGIVAVTWLLERPDSRAIAVDSSTEALALALTNARHHGVVERLEFVASDWTSALTAGTRFDLAVSNPPYLSLSEAPALPATVREYDPAAALFGGDDGLEDIRRLLDEVPPLLSAGAPFLFEIGARQADAVTGEVAARDDWRLDRIVTDLGGLPRVVILRRT